jgi:hypothetical protein
MPAFTGSELPIPLIAAEIFLIGEKIPAKTAFGTSATVRKSLK